jgi:uncharacterized protein (TIGR03067 family)
VKPVGSIMLVLLLAPFGASFGGEPAGPALIRSARSGVWSAPETWEGGKVPGVGARVQVRTGHAVAYDLSSDRVIRSVHVAGTLTFARDRDTRLDVGLVKIQPGDDTDEDGFNCTAHVKEPDPKAPVAALVVGTAEAPIPAGHTATIRLTPVEGLDRESCPALVCCGGRMELHGAPLSRTWVKLGATAKAGEGGVRLAEAASGWRVGDRVIVTTTASRERINSRVTLRPGGGGEPSVTEERTITGIDGDRLTLDAPLRHTHRGTGDFRGEVANLSRNVVVESADPKVRGHTMYHKYSAGSVGYAEFRHLGKEGVLGKYPIHFHLCGDTMRGSYVLGASVWDSGNRWVTVHGTNYLVVRDCVGYQSVGHGYFLEDGTEVFNVFDRNLAVQAYTGKPLPKQALPFDHNDGAGFWWANSLNTFTRNVAAECDRYGFRFEATPSKDFDLRLPIRQPDGTTEKVDVRTLPFVRFDGNEAHDQLFGINLGGLGGDFFKGGVGGVVPDGGHPFVVENTRLWNTNWAFSSYTRYAVDNLDIADSIYGLFLPAYSAEAPMRRLRPAAGSDEAPDFGGLTFRRTIRPVFLAPSGPQPTGEPFDLMEFAGDTLPPTTVITHVRRAKDGGLLVRGTTADDGPVVAVLVNGVKATTTAPNFAEWEAVLPRPAAGEMTVKAHAVDRAGNVEPRPHQRRVSVPAAELEEVVFLPMPETPAKPKEPETVKVPMRSDARALQGTWQVVSQQRAGRPTERPRDVRWVIEGDKVSVVMGKGPGAAVEVKKAGVPPKALAGAKVGSLMGGRLDAAASPPRIDLTVLKRAVYGICKVEGDELTVCLGVTQPLPSGYGKEGPPPSEKENGRPASIDPESGTVLVLRRVKD